MSNPESLKVTEHITAIDSQFRETIEFIRALFLKSDETISEHIKWNSPSFYYNGTMAAFDAKEYKRDLAVINLHRGKILIVFPTGNKIDSTIGLKGKDYPDGRRIVEILDLKDAENKSMILTKAVKNWISKIEK